MNSLSWMIYLADVCESTRFLAGLVSIVGAGAVAVAAIHWKWRIDFDGVEEERAAKKTFLSTAKFIVLPFSVAALLLVATPSKDTVYAIAASEMGEQVLKTPEANKARQALNAWLDKQIGDAKTVATPAGGR